MSVEDFQHPLGWYEHNLQQHKFSRSEFSNLLAEVYLHQVDQCGKLSSLVKILSEKKTQQYRTELYMLDEARQLCQG